MPRSSKKKGELTDKQKVFAKEYTVDLNQTQAAKRAGYSEKTAGSIGNELKSKPEVQAEIQKNMDERSERTNITADYVLSVVRDTVERCRQAEQVMEWDPIGKEMVPTGEWKFDAHNVLKGCDLLGKHLKLWTDGPKVDINVNLHTLSDEQLDQELKALESKLK